MSVGSLGRSIAAPPADASRIAAIRNKLDLRSASDIAGFGERARKDVLAGIERLLTEVRTNPLGDAADKLKGAQGRIEKLKPASLSRAAGWTICSTAAPRGSTASAAPSTASATRCRNCRRSWARARRRSRASPAR